MKAYMKAAWCKKVSWPHAVSASGNNEATASCQYMSISELSSIVEPSFCSESLNDRTGYFFSVCAAADSIGRFMQLKTPGFPNNARQHRMFGLSVLNIASAVKVLISNRKALPWRKLVDISVKWRQLSEPNDAVWWIDGFPEKNFAEGYGLETPIVQGQLRVIRYYSYFQKALDSVKDLLLSSNNKCSSGFPNSCCFKANGAPLGVEIPKQMIESSSELEDIWHSVGEDFYVITRYKSLCDADRYIEGTRITLLSSHPDGFQFSIRTPGTPSRWKMFEEEFAILSDLLNSLLTNIQLLSPDEKRHKLCEMALSWFYVWVVFAPLSRGSAICGYACLHSILLAGGLLIKKSLPKGVQLDWEAILSPTKEVFVESILSTWLLQATVDVDSAELETPSPCSIYKAFSSAPLIERQYDDDDVTRLFEFFDNNNLESAIALLSRSGSLPEDA